MELRGTQDRIAYFQRLLAQIRLNARPDKFAALATGYRAEWEKMQAEVMADLSRHASEPVRAA